ncbi:MAG: ABC transporter permease, partial [Clostridiales Family XIII bacterium]|nr:ABC transporter permease [Clostridiales Family XIII bacterium]
MEILESVLSYNLIHTAIRHSTPILLAAVAVIITQKSGVLNVGIEGIMTLGAFSAIVVSHFSGSPVLAVLCAAGAGALVAYVIGVAHLKFGADVFAVGMTINIFAVSLSIFLLSMLFGIRGSFKPDDLQTLPDIHIPALESSPVLDSLFNDYSLFEILAIAMVFMLRFYLNHTASGLRLQSVGLNEAAAETAGININRTKFYALLFSGVVGGLAGAHLSLGYANFFIPTIVSGRGFMGIAAMFFAGANPFISWLACLLFGMIDSIGARLQVYGLPSEFVM